MRKRRILLLTHESTVPPEDASERSDRDMLPWKAEYDVLVTLRELGHEVHCVGLRDELRVLREAIEQWKPHIAFNLVEEFHDVAIYDQNIISYLELLRLPYTGSNPRGLMLSHDKVLTKKILSYHRIPTPKFQYVERGSRLRTLGKLHYPLIVKSATEHASRGLTARSFVEDEASCKAQVEFIFDAVGTDALIEEYIAGREIYASVLGNQRLQIFPLWELHFESWPENVPRIATEAVKWDEDTQRKLQVKTGPVEELSEERQEYIKELAKRAYRRLHLSGYARLDFRIGPNGTPFLLEANANPNISFGEDFAESAEAAGLDYPALISKIMSLGLSYRAPWRESEILE